MMSSGGLRRSHIAILAAAFLGWHAPAQAAALFPNPAYPVGSNPYGMGLADFNGDGLDDLVTGSFANGYDGGPGSVTLLFGQGDGTFGESTIVPTQLHPTSVLAADFDGDGLGDLVIVYNQAGLAVTARGLGDGTFGPEQPVSNIVRRFQLADFNDDAIPDLLGDLNIGTGGFQAYLGNPDGSFTAAPGVVPEGADATLNPRALDLNGDGHDDVLTIRYVFGQDPHEVLVFLGNGDGSFAPAGSLVVPDEVQGLIGADLDGDGRDDLAATTHIEHPSGINGDVRLYFSNGDGTFTSGPILPETFATSIFASDRNGDGLQDFVRIGDYDVTPYLAAAPRAYVELPSFWTGSGTTGSVVGDFEGDGRSDLAILANFSEAVFVYAGNDAGGFGPPQDPPALDTYPGALLTRDFDGDGRLDMAAAVLPEDEIAVRLGQGDGTFGPATRSPAGVGPVFLEAMDMNGDGHLDLVVSLRHWHFEYPDPIPEGAVTILLGNGDGTFQPPGPSRTSGLNPQAMHVADLDGDGLADVVVANGGDGIVQPDLSFFHGLGDGTLAPAVRLDVGTEERFAYGWTFPMSLASGDFDGDARQDLVVAVSGLYDPGVPGTVRVLRGLPGGAFAPFVTVGETDSSASVAVADLDADGDADIVVADVASYTAQRPGGLFTLLNDGTGAFVQSPILASGIGPYFVQVADLTGDGIPDLVASANAGYAAILAGLGGGAYAEPIFFGTPATVVPGDFDGDGFQDLLGVSFVSSFVMLNQTPSEVSLLIDATLSFTSPLGRGSGTLTFTTNTETDLVGFNVVEITAMGTTTINRALIPCEECTNGRGATYTFLVPKHRSGRNFYVEAIHAGGATEFFGPARRE
jgi:hypothetical protein